MGNNKVNQIEAYIKKNASSTIQQRAKQIRINSFERSGNTYLFSYSGSLGVYQISVSFTKNGIQTSCDCPYDFGGLCKHEVSSLNHLLKFFNSEKSDSKEPSKSQSKTSKKTVKAENFAHIKIPENSLTIEKVRQILRDNKINEHFYKNEITTISKEKNTIEVQARFNYFEATQQKISYIPDKKELQCKCDCYKFTRSKACAHLGVLLEHLIEYFGEKFFLSDYEEEIKQKFIEDNQLTPEKFDKYFKLEITPEGYVLRCSRDNFVLNLDDFTRNLDLSSNLDEQLTLKKSSSKNQGVGFGICFETLGSSSKLKNFLIYPFQAKLKKDGSEFSSSFQRLDAESIVLSDLISDTERVLFTKVIRLNDSLERFYQGKSVENLHNIFVDFQEVQDSLRDFPMLMKDYRDSFVKKNLNPIEIAEQYAELKIHLNKKDDFLTLQPKIIIDGKALQPNSNLIKMSLLGCVREHIFYPFKSAHTPLYLMNYFLNKEINFLQSDKAEFYKKVITPLSKHFEIITKVYSEQKSKNDLEVKKQVYLSDYEGEYIMFRPVMEYQKELVLLEDFQKIYDEKTGKLIPRDTETEQEFLEFFKGLHPDFQEQEKFYFLSPEDLIHEDWLLRASHKMEQQNIEVLGAKDLKSFRYNINKPQIRVSAQSQIDWFDLNIEVQFGNQKASLKEIRKAILNKSRYVPLKDGTLGILPEDWMRKFGKFFKSGEVNKEKLQISNYQFNIIDDLFEVLESTPEFLMKLQRKKQALKNLKEIKENPTPKQLKAQLRDYQQAGLNWLIFLHENQLGGCLADDMGLGKTIQTIAFLTHLKAQKASKKPHLIVAPTSLMFNWEKEIEKFSPKLKILLYTGIDRQKYLPDFEKYDIILTTYGSVINDIEELQKHSFSYLILDESQAIKNPTTKRYKSVQLLSSENRLALTGTPIENRTFDLYSQMNFLNPGLLGSMNHFRTQFADSIDKEKNEDSAHLLSRMIQPFLLRRTKEQVATELPEKTESVIYCEMSKSQRKVYETFRDKYRQYLLEKIDEQGAEKSQMYVLEGLMKLRQICNSPQLLSEDEDYGRTSIKLDILTEHIKEKTDQHKVLVFSQFTGMLSLIKDRLDDEGITYEYLDGQTRNREEKVENFQENEEVRVFLISLKAGGVGLNLTAADYVYLVDPWWNPAVESQAIDRCYRIGQTQKVMAYRMICKDTIEEKIIKLQDSKKALSESIIKVDRMQKSFDKKEIEDLFS